jgi:hypothetical protein
MNNCGTWMMSERRRCHYYVRGKTWHEEAFNVKHLCVQQCPQIFFSIKQPTINHENMHKKLLQMCTLKLLCLQDQR